MRNDELQGLTAVISVKVPEPEFEGQTKNRLGNPEVRGIVDQIVNDELVKVFEWHPKVIENRVWRMGGCLYSAGNGAVMCGSAIIRHGNRFCCCGDDTVLMLVL